MLCCCYSADTNRYQSDLFSFFETGLGLTELREIQDMLLNIYLHQEVAAIRLAIRCMRLRCGAVNERNSKVSYSLRSMANSKTRWARDRYTGIRSDVTWSRSTLPFQ